MDHPVTTKGSLKPQYRPLILDGSQEVSVLARHETDRILRHVNQCQVTMI